MSDGAQTMWLDVSAGVAGDMLLGALVDAGASVSVLQAAVDAVLPGAVFLSSEAVTRAGLRATKVSVTEREAGSVHRSWRDIEGLLLAADLPAAVRRDALAVFARLAGAEARVHGIAVADVRFHEVGGLDAIADVVGTCAAIHDLNVESIVASPISLGSGRVRTEHGVLPVPVPAVLEMTAGWLVSAAGDGELATPTGVALVTALAQSCSPLPAMRLHAVGVGAGTRDPGDRANVVRAVIGEGAGGGPDDRDLVSGGATLSSEVVLEANVDDLDPRVWPSVLAALLDAGAADAWLSPIVMKKGRPAHTLHVLGTPDRADELLRVMIAQTPTIGVRRTDVSKFALARAWRPVEVLGGVVRIKVAHEGGVIRRAGAEFEDARAVAEQAGVPVLQVLGLAGVAAVRAGLVPGAPVPDPTGADGSVPDGGTGSS